MGKIRSIAAASFIFGVAVSAVTSQANAGVIIQAASVTASSIFSNSGFNNPNNLANQSGLSANYVSGVSDFDTYLASTTHVDNDVNDSWASASGNITNEFTDFDFGVSIDLTRLALFGDNGTNSNNINSFTVLIGNDPTFAAFTNLGSFNASIPNPNPVTPQIFDVADGSGQYVRVQLNTTHGGSGGVFIYGEGVFEASVTNVPEPGTLVILGLGLVGLCVARRRKAV